MEETIKTIALAMIPALFSYIATQKECNNKISEIQTDYEGKIRAIKTDYEGKINAMKIDYDGKIKQYDKNRESDVKYKFIEKLMNTKQVNRVMQDQFCEYFKDKNIFGIKNIENE